MKKRLLIPLLPLIGLIGCGGDSGGGTIFPLRDAIAVTPVSQLPAEIAVGVSYPIEYTFTNVGSQPATGLNFPRPQAMGLTINDPTSTCLTATMLNPQQSCSIAGSFIAGAPGPHTFGSMITYDGGFPLDWVVTTQALNVVVQVTTDTPLPANVMSGDQNPIRVTFTNTGSADAIMPGTGGFIVESTPNNVFLMQTSNTCTSLPNNRLVGGASCVFDGMTTAQPSSPNTYTLTLNYNGTQATAMGSTTVSTVPLTGAPTSAGTLPVHTAIGETYTVAFTFTNTSATTQATGITYADSGFTRNTTASTCGATLAAGASCTITGSFTPAESHLATQSTTVSVTASYPQGQDVVTSTTTEVTRRVVIPFTLNSSHTNVNSRTPIFSYNTDLLPTIKTQAATLGNPDTNYFLILASVNPNFVNANSFISTPIHNAPLVDTVVNFTTNRNSPLTLRFRANRPQCDAQGTNGLPASRQLNDRTICGTAVTSAERQVTVQMDATSFNALPAGIHTFTLRLSNQYYLRTLAGPGGFASMPVINFTVTR